jgi:hypothetical protein
MLRTEKVEISPRSIDSSSSPKFLYGRKKNVRTVRKKGGKKEKNGKIPPHQLSLPLSMPPSSSLLSGFVMKNKKKSISNI